ncbi:MAG: hypothetical protein Ct9H300mP4_15250 [Gammaproteobacteria bacterium]|nr:MAG: hypothetical protein Ct9H300mP4_15250 [Gammaproteobacteria bacterium]
MAEKGLEYTSHMINLLAREHKNPQKSSTESKWSSAHLGG